MCRSRRSVRISSMRIWSPSGSSTYRSGWARRSTRPRSPRSSAANANAALLFPTPAGPWKRWACAGPSLIAASSSRFASACSTISSNTRRQLLPDLGGDLVPRPGPVERHDPLEEALRDRAVALLHRLAESGALALDPVLGTAAEPLGDGRGVDEQHEGAVREEVGDG